jgi:alcohol dehydrogenase (cytochrome c)
VKSREIFIPVGNPAPTLNSGSRPGANLFTNSLVVLDADTGALKWWYQVSPNDARDHDLAAPPVLFNLADGRPAVALGSKNGYVLVLDRRSHNVMFRTPVTTIYNEGKPVTSVPTRFCPGIVGGMSWNGPAFDPQQHLLIAGATDWCAIFQKSAPQYVRGQLYWGGVTTPETQPSPSGWITALDANSGRIRWRYHAPAPVVSGITVTGGGLTFAGDLSGTLYAFRTADGGKLFDTNLGGAIAGGISTYSVHGHQYVAVTSGNISRQLWGISGTPSIRILSTLAPTGQSNPSTTSQINNLGQNTDATGLPDSNHGKLVFASTCALCHGGAGEGATGADLRKNSHTRSEVDIVDLVINPPKAMPKLYPSTLSRQDVVDVAAYVSQFGHDERQLGPQEAEKEQ